MTAATVLLVVVATTTTTGLLLAWITIQLANDQRPPWAPTFTAGPARPSPTQGQRVTPTNLRDAYLPAEHVRPTSRPMWMAVAHG